MKILITGISSGIGMDLARNFIETGHEIWGLARRQEPMEKLKNEFGNKLNFSVCNIGNLEDLQKTGADMREKRFLPDIVVLNAAVRLHDAEKNLEFDFIKSSIDVNINGSLFWVSEFLPEFIKRKSGTFVAISSTSALKPGLGSVSYSLTKAALDMAFEGLRLNYSDSGVKFITVRFGPIKTEMWEGKDSFLVSSSKKAAEFVSFVTNKKSGVYYFPFLSTSLFRLSRILPNKIFNILTQLLKK